MADWQGILGGLGAGLQDAGAHLQGQPGQANKVSQFKEYMKDLDNDKAYTKAAKDLEVVQSWMAINQFSSQQEMIQRMQGDPVVFDKWKSLKQYMDRPDPRAIAMKNTVSKTIDIEAQTQKKDIAQRTGTLEKQLEQGFKVNPGQAQQVPAPQVGMLQQTKFGGQNAKPATGPMFKDMANPPMNIQAPPLKEDKKKDPTAGGTWQTVNGKMVYITKDQSGQVSPDAKPSKEPTPRWSKGWEYSEDGKRKRRIRENAASGEWEPMKDAQWIIVGTNTRKTLAELKRQGSFGDNGGSPAGLKPIPPDIVAKIKKTAKTRQEAEAMAIEMGYDPNRIAK